MTGGSTQLLLFESTDAGGKDQSELGKMWQSTTLAQQSKWMKCNSKWCSKGTCPGYANTAHGMESSGKWQQCYEYVFKIYARGRKLGQIIQANDAILLYTLGYSKWVSVYNGWIAQGTCPGTERLPSLNKYDTCSDAVFELWKKMNH